LNGGTINTGHGHHNGVQSWSKIDSVGEGAARDGSRNVLNVSIRGDSRNGAGSNVLADRACEDVVATRERTSKRCASCYALQVIFLDGARGESTDSQRVGLRRTTVGGDNDFNVIVHENECNGLRETLAVDRDRRLHKPSGQRWGTHSHKFKRSVVVDLLEATGAKRDGLCRSGIRGHNNRVQNIARGRACATRRSGNINCVRLRLAFLCIYGSNKSVEPWSQRNERILVDSGGPLDLTGVQENGCNSGRMREARVEPCGDVEHSLNVSRQSNRDVSASRGDGNSHRRGASQSILEVLDDVGSGRAGALISDDHQCVSFRSAACRDHSDLESVGTNLEVLIGRQIGKATCQVELTSRASGGDNRDTTVSLQRDISDLSNSTLHIDGNGLAGLRGRQSSGSEFHRHSVGAVQHISTGRAIEPSDRDSNGIGGGCAASRRKHHLELVDADHKHGSSGRAESWSGNCNVGGRHKCGSRDASVRTDRQRSCKDET